MSNTNDAYALPYPIGTDQVAVAGDVEALAVKSGLELGGVEARAKAYADNGDASTLTSAKSYADGAADNVNPYRGRALSFGATADDITTTGIYAVYTSTDAGTLGLPPFPGTLKAVGYDGVIEQRFDVTATDDAWSYTRKRPRGEAWGPWVGTDTQRRDITGNLINGWTASEVTIRRIGSRITVAFIYLNYTDATSDNFLTLPSGFRALSVRVPAVLGDIVGIATATSGGELSIPRLGQVRNARTTELSFEVDPAEPWPLNLPGTSA